MKSAENQPLKIDISCKRLISEGYELLEDGELQEACDTWYEAWQYFKSAIPRNIRNIEETLDMNRGEEYIPNWIQDMTTEMSNEGISRPMYYQKTIDICNEVIRQFGNSDKKYLHSLKRTIAEAYFGLKDQEMGDKCFQELVDQYPDNIWSFVGWGDMYLHPIKKKSIKNIGKAEEYFKRAKPKDEFEREVINQRLQDVEKERSLTTI